MNATYRIVRYYQSGRESLVIKSGLSLGEAQEHCNDPETSSRTGVTDEVCNHTYEYGQWFDGYTEE